MKESKESKENDEALYLPYEDCYTLRLIARAKGTTPQELISRWITCILANSKTDWSDEP